MAWDLIHQLTEQGISLVNDESVPTFYQGNNRPQVNDLMWIHQDAFLDLATDVEYNIFGPTLIINF